MTNHPPILLQNTSFSYVKCAKYLCVYIDAILNWKSHTSNVFIKISQGCGIIQYSYNFLPNFILKMLYYALVYSYLIYCIEILGQCCESV